MRANTLIRWDRSRTLTSAVATAAIMMTLGLVLAAPALAKEPTGDFAVFKQCPRFTEGVALCLYAETLSGEVKLNKQTVPIKNKITLQGGIKVNPETGAESFVGALNGETLSKTAQLVPGGLLGTALCEALPFFLKGLCEEFLSHGLTEVKATTELARSASEITVSTHNLEVEEGTTLGLPVKVHLENLFLGRNCYIGSSSKPIQLNLTNGVTNPNPPNTSISGKTGESEFKDGFELLVIHENTLVNNEFSAPEATGCGGIFSFLIDPVIDTKIGLPAADGVNTAIENNTLEIAGVPGVIGSEK